MTKFDLADVENIDSKTVEELQKKAVEQIDYFAELVLDDYFLCVNEEFEVKVTDFESLEEQRQEMSYNELETLSMISELVGIFLIKPSMTENLHECPPPNIHPDTTFDVADQVQSE